jgi:hypothetical protein
MPVRFLFDPSDDPNRRKKNRQGKPPKISLDQPGRLHLDNLQSVFDISHTTVYKRIEQGILPAPDGYDMPNRPKGKRGRPYWFTSTIRPYLGPEAA